MRTLISAVAALAALATAAPALAQEKATEWTPASMKSVLEEMGYKITREGLSGTDYTIAASAPNGGLPINIYGVACKAGPACPKADFTTGFKLKDEGSKEPALAKVMTVSGVRGVLGRGSVPIIRIEAPVDFSAGMTRDEIKAKFVDYQKTADTAFETLKSAGLLAN